MNALVAERATPRFPHDERWSNDGDKNEKRDRSFAPVVLAVSPTFVAGSRAKHFAAPSGGLPLQRAAIVRLL
jgi:hypothetical protein